MGLRSINCLVLLSISLLASAFAAQSPSSNLPNSVKISYQAFHGDPSKSLATVLYDPATLKCTLASWTPPSLDNLKPSTPEPSSGELLRVLVPSGSSTLTSIATFNNTLNQTIDLWLSPNGDGSILSASISASAPLTPHELKEKAREDRRAARSPNKAKLLKQHKPNAGTTVKVNLIPPTAGPTPLLTSRKPAVVDAEGREVPAEELQEKTMLQKYWWVILIGVAFLLTAGGDK